MSQLFVDLAPFGLSRWTRKTCCHIIQKEQALVSKMPLQTERSAPYVLVNNFIIGHILQLDCQVGQLQLHLHQPSRCFCTSWCNFQSHCEFDYVSLSRHLLLGEQNSYMGEKPDNESFSMLHVLDLEHHPIQQNLELLVIITHGFSLFLLNILDPRNTLRL